MLSTEQRLNDPHDPYDILALDGLFHCFDVALYDSVRDSLVRSSAQHIDKVFIELQHWGILHNNQGRKWIKIQGVLCML